MTQSCYIGTRGIRNRVIWGPYCINLRAISQDTHQLSITKISLEIEKKICSNITGANELTHWGRVTHICVSKRIKTGSDNGLSPGRRQSIIWTNDGILLIGPLRTNFSEILSKIQTFSFKKMHLKTSSAKWRPFFSVSMCLPSEFHSALFVPL